LFGLLYFKLSYYSAKICTKSKTVADKAGIKLKIVDILNSWLLNLRLARESCTSRFCKPDDCSLKTTQNSGTISIT